jgi:hypothetical protein
MMGERVGQTNFYYNTGQGADQPEGDQPGAKGGAGTTARGHHTLVDARDREGGATSVTRKCIRFCERTT